MLPELVASQLDAARATSQKVRAAFADLFQQYDFIVLPCAPMPALTKAQCTLEARTAILTFTTPASLAGLPVLTSPVPLPLGLTAGLQIIAPRTDSPVFQWALKQQVEPLGGPTRGER